MTVDVGVPDRVTEAISCDSVMDGEKVGEPESDVDGVSDEVGLGSPDNDDDGENETEASFVVDCFDIVTDWD